MKLPAGHTVDTFNAFWQKLTAIVGQEFTVQSETGLAPYQKLMIPSDIENHDPAGVVTPTSVDQVQSIMKLCNEAKVSVWPISTGRNFGYGTAAPVMAGTLVLDLGRMNKILSFDERLGVVQIEPGVTYRQLSAFLKENNHKYWLSVPGSGGIVGPMGQALERGVSYTPYGDNFAHSCGFEVVLADGTLFRTGDGSIEGTRSFNTTQYGYGPYLDGMFTQSNYGVITKMGLWLMPQPDVYKPFLVAFRQHDDLTKAVDICQQLTLKGVIKSRPIVGHVLYEIAQRHKRADVHESQSSVSDAWVTDYITKNRMGVWVVNAALYGSKEQVAADWKLVKRAFKGSGGMVLTDFLLNQDTGWQHAKRMLSGQLDLDEFRLYNWRGGGGSAWFAVSMPAKGEEADRFMRLAKSVMREFDFDYLGGFMVQGREVIAVVDILFDKTDPEQEDKAHKCYAKLMEESGKIGLSVYRTNIAFMDAAANLQGEERKEVNRRIKQALDPNGIIAPGKSGITL